MQPVPTVPRAKKKPHEFNEPGHRRTDNYYWLRERDNPEVIDYLKAENEYAENGLAPVKGLREKLFGEITGRIAQKDMSAPYTMRGYSYYRRYEENREYAVFCRRPMGSDVEEVILDGNERAEGHAFYQIGGLEISDDNRLAAIGEDTLSRRIYTIRFMDLKRGTPLEDTLEGTTGTVAWAADNATVYYTVKDPQTLRAFKVCRHRLGTSQGEDEVVFEEKDDTFHAFAHRSKSGAFVLISSKSTETSEHRIVDASDPVAVPRVFQSRQRGLEYDVAHDGDRFVVLHNADARNFMVSETPLNATERTHWTPLIPHREDVLVQDLEVFRDFLVLEERVNGLIQLRIMPNNAKDNKDRYVKFPDPTYMAYLSVNKEYDSEILRYGYTSLTTPATVYDIRMTDGKTELIKREKVLGDFDPENYASERFFVKARDGAEVPVSLVYRKGFDKSGNAPLLLYGYGSYGMSMDAYFSSPRLSLLDRGFVFAIAHVRGGEEMGRRWYEMGKMENKMNTFRDFIDCADHLVQHKYTSPDHLYAMGGSAGGLLMGAVVNMRPELWNGIVAQVPFVDVLTTMLDASIPLTTGEYDEWGNPNDPKAYETIRAYSPYDNLKEGPYPAMLVTTGLHDSQVQYWEPAKWVAKIRDLKTNDTPLYLVTNLDTGHGGASGRFERYREVALDYAFLLWRAGIAE